jgi:hypothetical protein
MIMMMIMIKFKKKKSEDRKNKITRKKKKMRRWRKKKRRFSGHGCTLRLFQNFGMCCIATFRVRMATAMHDKLEQFRHTFDLAKPQKLKLHIRQRT